MTNKTNTQIKFKKNSFQVNLKNQNKIIIEYTPLIKYLASKILSKIGYRLELNELISYGVLGLIDAIEKYDPSRDNKFKTYAEFRIRGAMLDYLREEDFTPRSVRDKIKIVEKASKELEKDLCRKPTAFELAEKLKITYQNYFELENYTKKLCFLSIDAVSSASSTMETKLRLEDQSLNPDHKLSLDSVKETLNRAMSTLAEREKRLVSMYYYEDKNLKEIAEELGICESRASQIHSKAMSALKEELDELKEDLDLAA